MFGRHKVWDLEFTPESGDQPKGAGLTPLIIGDKYFPNRFFFQ
jgi:hypothetical protein